MEPHYPAAVPIRTTDNSREASPRTPARCAGTGSNHRHAAVVAASVRDDLPSREAVVVIVAGGQPQVEAGGALRRGWRYRSEKAAWVSHSGCNTRRVSSFS